MESEQIEQVVIGRRRLDAEQATALIGAGQVIDAAQAWNVAEQLLDRIGEVQALQRPDADLQRARAVGRDGYRRWRGRRGHHGRRGRHEHLGGR